jgi:hypothetical protein
LGEIPFYFVQIAPYYQDAEGKNGISGALLREQQIRAADIIPNSDIVCTNDLVYPSNGHRFILATKKLLANDSLTSLSIIIMV